MLFFFSKKKGPWGDWENGDDSKLKGNDILNFLKRFFNFDHYSFEKKERKIKDPNFSFGKIFTSLILLIFAIWLLSGFYIVGPEQQALNVLFGKYKDFKVSGLHYYYPYPIGSIKKVNVTSVHTMEIGLKSANKDFKVFDNSMESIMITRDENMVEVNFDVQWRIGNAVDFEFNFRRNDAIATIRSICESSMRKIIGNYDMSAVLEGTGRATIANDIMLKIQEYVESYGLGIDVVSVQIKRIDPPVSVIDSFRDVQSAKADKEKFINDSYLYVNSVIPDARGRASKIKNDALGHSKEIINSAKGETERFLKIYNEYVMSKGIIKRKIYLDAINEVVPKWDKIILDDKNSMIKHYALDEINKNKKKD